MATDTIVEVVMPQMGVSVSEGTVSRWLKAEGEMIEKDETLLEISTDKVDTEVPSPASGVVTKIHAEEGETIDVGEMLAEIDPSGEAGGSSSGSSDAPAPQEQAAPETPAQQEPPAASAPAPSQSAPAPASTPAPAANGSAAGGAARFVSPVVARIAAEKGIDPSTVPGTGSGGRVTKKDILAFIDGGGEASAPSQTPSPAQAPAGAKAAVQTPGAPAQTSPAPQQSSAPVPTTQATPFTGEERVENFSPMRKAIAKHMVDSVQTSPHVTSTMEVDMTRVVNMRNRVKDELMSQWGVKVTFTHFAVRAMVDAISHYPLINAEIRGESAVIKSYINLGIAVALEGGAGLIVPVLRNAEEKNLVGIARGVNDLAARARNKKLTPDDVSGGTFTLTNPGIYGAVHGTPIINQPQVAILDTEAIVKRPVVVTDAEGNDAIAVRSMMNLCMSYDHRLIDGAYAVQFLAHLKRNLQEWEEHQFLG